MARARNIKPSIMDNEELALLSPIARLLFIYLWMLADKQGRLEDRPARIGKQALGYDNIDTNELLSQLHESNFIARYNVNGIKVIQILNFEKHQTPHVREADSTLPSIEESTTKVVLSTNQGSAEASPRSPDSLIPDSLIPDSLNKEIDKSISSEKVADEKTDDLKKQKKKTEQVPYQQILELYQEHLPMLNGVYKLTDDRKNKIKSLWLNSELNTLDRWKNYFLHIKKSKFLTGRGPPDRSGRVWKADLDFLINSTNFVKISEDKYHG